MAKYTTNFDKPPEEWSFLGFYQHRHNERNFTFSFMKESYILKKCLEERQEIPLAKKLAKSFKDAPRDVPLMLRNHRQRNEEIDSFWNKVEFAHLEEQRALRTKRCHVNISSKTQDMMENIAEDTVEAHLLTKKRRIEEDDESVAKHTRDIHSSLGLDKTGVSGEAMNNTFPISKYPRDGEDRRSSDMTQYCDDDYYNTCTSSKRIETDASVLNQISNQETNNESNEIEGDSDGEVDEELDEQLTFDYDFLEREIKKEREVEWVADTINVTSKFKKYQLDLVYELKKRLRKLTWNDTTDILAIASIMIIDWPCRYDCFTFEEWKLITNNNPYKLKKPLFDECLSSSLNDALYKKSVGFDVDFEPKKGLKYGIVIKKIFDYVSDDLPLFSPTKTSEDEHRFLFLDPLLKPIFSRPYTPYEIKLNWVVNASKKRPDFLCHVDNVPILNSEQITQNPNPNIQA
ncbi:6674_t:CDS:10 [Paraglomus occultum]|uniref:6674_t:CDS:1 n=1 Tax=Paraglomus occultum TaxID=144539 RepID=A0A9N9BYH3_9GLOM|nr:6674_t:CDS:10 [Paraglomus occultum]